MREVIMGYQGEMSLKGLNRNQFESTMMKILRYRLKTVGKFRVYCTQSTFYMEPEEDDIDMDLAFERVSKVFGLAALSRAVVCEKDFDTIGLKHLFIRFFVCPDEFAWSGKNESARGQVGDPGLVASLDLSLAEFAFGGTGVG